MGTNVVEMIEEVGARVLLTAPYSPDLNPIKFMFAEYKKALNRVSTSMHLDWMERHLRAMIHCVTPAKARAFFGGEGMRTEEGARRR